MILVALVPVLFCAIVVEGGFPSPSQPLIKGCGCFGASDDKFIEVLGLCFGIAVIFQL